MPLPPIWRRVGWTVALVAYASAGYAADDPKVAIACRVLDDIESKGVGGARVTLQPRDGGDALSGFTTEAGACPFKGVPPGPYTLSVDKAGYFPISEPQAIAFAAAGQKVDLGAIFLTVKRRIQGVVRWSNGDPAEGVMTHVLVVRGGRANWRPGDPVLAPTNDRGEFLLQNLRPATYILYAYTLGFRRDGVGRPALPVYYPDLPAPNLQAGIDLRKVKEASELTLTLKDAEGVTVSGKVEPSPKLPEGAPIYVGLMTADSPSQPFLGIQSKAGQMFRLQNVPPGNYTLLVASVEANNRSVLPLSVGTAPIENLQVPFVDSHDVDCTFEYAPGTDSGKAPAPSLSAARLSGTSDALGLFGFVGGRVGPDGKARLQVLVPGYRYKLHVQPPPGSYVARMLQSGTELPALPAEISADGGPVRILLGLDGGTVSGLLTDRDGKAASGFTVLMPDNPAKQDWIKTATPGADGRFEMTVVAPGKYHLFALYENDNDAYLDPKYLEGHPSREIVVKPSARQTADLRLPPR